MGVCKTPLHNILQKLLIIRIINFAKGASRTSRELWQTVALIRYTNTVASGRCAVYQNLLFAKGHQKI